MLRKEGGGCQDCQRGSTLNGPNCNHVSLLLLVIHRLSHRCCLLPLTNLSQNLTKLTPRMLKLNMFLTAFARSLPTSTQPTLFNPFPQPKKRFLPLTHLVELVEQVKTLSGHIQLACILHHPKVHCHLKGQAHNTHGEF